MRQSLLFLVVLIRSFLISPFKVVGSSMADTLQNKEFILIDKLSYTLGDIDRGDPVVFLPPATSKDIPKFEESVTVDASHAGRLDISSLRKSKDAVYCKGILKAFFFCKEGVEKNDLAYYAPRVSTSGTAHVTNWEDVEVIEISKEDIKKGEVSFPGDEDDRYTVRIYSSMGVDYFVKRVIGVPGDEVKIDSGRVYLKRPDDYDFVQIKEPFLNQENLNKTYINQKHRQNVYTVPEGEYFVMGDNRNHSNDSRGWLEPITQEAFPFVPEANISGKVLVVLWPIGDLRFIGSADFF